MRVTVLKLKHRLWFYANDGVLMAHSAEELQTGCAIHTGRAEMQREDSM